MTTLLDLPDDIIEYIHKINLEYELNYADIKEGVKYLITQNNFNEIELGELLYDRLKKSGYTWEEIEVYERDIKDEYYL